MKIQVLPVHLRQQIAAGEVIERPASVVKELIENALDAGAQQIRVEVEHAGRQLIRVTDDGAGIGSEEVPLAFERFATSKIHESVDLESIRTFGFRGEALPSIAAASRVRLLTRPHGEPLGTCARLEGGTPVGIREAGAPVGTRVEVRDLFFNMPVRRKFLRSLRVELSHIIGVFTGFALAFPELAWMFVCDGKPLFELTPSPYRERLVTLYGQEAIALLQPFDAEGLSGRVWGHVSRDPAASRRSYHLFVNRRPVRSASLYRAAHAVLRGAGTLILFLEIAPAVVDVNVHPAKREVRFRDEEGVYDLVLSSLSRVVAAGGRQAAGVAEREEPYASSASPAARETFQGIGQVERTFLLAYAQGYLYLIDQHAAHERVLYDRLLDALACGEPPRRMLVAPQVLLLSSRELELFETHRPELEACGFVYDRFGPDAVAVRAIPDVVPAREAEQLCRRLIQRLREDAANRRNESVPQMVSCLGALKAGTVLLPEEQARLLHEWQASHQPHACAHNRPVYFRVNLDEVRQKVGRTPSGCYEASDQ